MLRPIFYDLETTGFQSTDRVIEIAAYDPFRGLSFQQLINPQCQISTNISRITGIYNYDCKSAPIFSKIIDKFNEFCQGNACLIAHNNKFDQKFLTREYQSAGRTIPSYWEFFDSLPWIRWKYP